MNVNHLPIPTRRLVQVLLGLAAAVLLMQSMRHPWWSLQLLAPQYPQGLEATAYLTKLAGDVAEIDALNHYIGMMKLDAAAKLERDLVPYALPVFAGLTMLAALLPGRWSWLLHLPTATFPLVFLLDLKWWLWRAGHSLDPKAAMSSSIKPFTPTLLGEGRIAQFGTYGWVELGFWLALAAALLCILAAAIAWRPAPARLQTPPQTDVQNPPARLTPELGKAK